MAVDVTKRESAPSRSGVINLDKRGQTLCLDKKSGFDRIVVNLNWNQGRGGGLLKSLLGMAKKTNVDLDLGCLFELNDGQKGSVQALGNTFGNYDRAPYIQLLGDDRTGSNAEGEFLWINGKHFSEIRRVLVYAFIYEGVASWADTDGVITLTTPGHETIRVEMDYHANKRLCAIAMIENDRGNLKITKLVEYFNSQSEADRAYGWGMEWTPGRK